MLEAMAAECLVIASATAPVFEVIKDRENGLLVDFFSAEQIVDRIDEALEHTDGMRDIRKRARSTIVDRFDLKTKALPAQLELVNGLISGKKGKLAQCVSDLRGTTGINTAPESFPGNRTTQEVAEDFLVHYANVSRAVKQ